MACGLFPTHPTPLFGNGGGGIVLRSSMIQHVSAKGSESMLDASIPVCWTRFSTKWVKGSPYFIFVMPWDGGGYS